MSDSLPVRTAILTDLHANREAVEAVLEHAQDQRMPTAYALLGDFVGYGADPGWVVDRVRAWCAEGAWRCRATTTWPPCAAPSPDMRPEPRTGDRLDAPQLDAAQLDFLASCR
jgi:hypothetical protein